MIETVDYRPFAKTLPPGRARALPWATVLAGSLVTTLPFIASLPLLPPCGLLMLLAWRLLAPYSLRTWAAAPLGLADDLVSGQPLGSAMLLWSLVFLAIELIEQRLAYRDFWQEWLIAGTAIAACLILGRFIAVPIAAPIDGLILAQVAISVLLFPAAAFLVGWIDRKRGPA